MRHRELPDLPTYLTYATILRGGKAGNSLSRLNADEQAHSHAPIGLNLFGTTVASRSLHNLARPASRFFCSRALVSHSLATIPDQSPFFPAI